jgi:hypothetical protein
MNQFELQRSRQSEISYCGGAVISAVKLLLTRDITLLAIGTHEQGICHRLAVYLEPWFSTYSVDCEYNRIQSKVKRVLIDNKKRIVKPDILIHERLRRENCLAVEAKATSNPESECEPVKLIGLLNDADFHYNLGLFLIIDNAKREILERGYVEVRGQWLGTEELKNFKLRQPLDPYTVKWVQSRER